MSRDFATFCARTVMLGAAADWPERLAFAAALSASSVRACCPDVPRAAAPPEGRFGAAALALVLAAFLGCAPRRFEGIRKELFKVCCDLCQLHAFQRAAFLIPVTEM